MNRIKNKLIVFWNKLRLLARLQEDTDAETTILSIKKAAEFKGVNLWILVFAIVIASVGLDVNSTAVIIGAMLISPVMGPIMGIGLAIGIFDTELLKKSLKNLGLMVLISIVASTIYFLISPFSVAQSELLARTRPTTFDVIIAVFGGLAGIVAASRKEQMFTVTSGVAIATALMPPLCTAAFGLATLQFSYFFGAFYLFFINSFFIALATFIMARYLHFPVEKFINTSRESAVKRSVIIFAIIVVIPSLFMAVRVVRESSFNSQVGQFISDLQNENTIPGTFLLHYDTQYDRKKSTVTLSFIGNELSSKQIDSLQMIMTEKYGLYSTQLKIKQTSDLGTMDSRAEVLEDLLQKKDETVQQLKQEVKNLEDTVQLLSQQAQIYNEQAQKIGQKYQQFIQRIAIAENTYYNTQDGSKYTVPVLYILWKPNIEHKHIEQELSVWVPLLLSTDHIEIINQN